MSKNSAKQRTMEFFEKIAKYLAFFDIYKCRLKYKGVVKYERWQIYCVCNDRK